MSAGAAAPHQSDLEDDIFVAAYHGDIRALRRLLAAGRSPNERSDIIDQSLLHNACCFAATAESQADRGITLKYQPLEVDYLACCRLLVEAGTNIDSRDGSGDSVLVYATCCATSAEAIKSIEFLLDAGADVNAVGDNSMTPLHWAACNRSAEAVALYLRRGAAVNAIDDRNETPLETAIRFSQSRHYPLLLSAGSVIPSDTSVPYLRAVLDAGSFRNFEQQHLDRLVMMLTPKSSPPDGRRRSRRRLSPLRHIPPDVLRKIAAFAFHAGYYVY